VNEPSGPRKPTPDTPRDVDELLAKLGHPLQADIAELRQLIRSAAEGVGEAVKWNSPSFHRGEYFATLRLNGKVPIQLILHPGARKAAAPVGTIDDPVGLLDWLGPDRACVSFTEPGQVRRRADALRAVLGQWIRSLPAA
jgi:hypothetical protein